MIGLAPGAVRAYRLLLRLPTASVGELAVGLNMSMMDVRKALRGLEAKGLVGRLPGAVHRFQAAAPAEVLGPLARRRHRELRADVDVLGHEYRDGTTRRTDSSALVTGAQSLRVHADRIMARATAEVCVVADRPPDVLDGLRAGVKLRAIYPRAMLAAPAFGPRVSRHLHSGAQARVCDHPPVDMVVVDRSVAMLAIRSTGRSPATGPDHSAETGARSGERPRRDGAVADPVDMATPGPFAVIVRPGRLHDMLLAAFESAWAVGTPLRTEADGTTSEDSSAAVPSSEDLALLSLLLEGLTDQAIAGRLGVGERTVQRHVRDLIDLVGVQTRLQLIWQATQRGWI